MLPPASSCGGGGGGNAPRPRRRVSFSNVQVREYEQVLSYNPACSEGAAIGIGWKYYSEECRSVEEFEFERPHPLPRDQLFLSKEDRARILEKRGYGPFDLASSEREIRMVQMNRLRTLRKLEREEKKKRRKERMRHVLTFFGKRQQPESEQEEVYSYC